MESKDISDQQDGKEIIKRKDYPFVLTSPRAFPYAFKTDEKYDKRFDLFSLIKNNVTKLHFHEVNEKYREDGQENEQIEQEKIIYKKTLEIHPKGFLLCKYSDNKAFESIIIPGELSLAQIVNFLSKDIINTIYTKKVEDVSSLFNEVNNEIYNIVNNHQEVFYQVKHITRSLQEKNMNKVIAHALINSGLWKNRGYTDSEKIAPKSFWQNISDDQLNKIQNESIEDWWKNEIFYEAKFACRDNLYKEKFADLHAILKSDIDHDIIKQKINEGFLPRYPWDVPNWEKISFGNLKKSVIFGLHHLPLWESYTEKKAPHLRRIIEMIELDFHMKSVNNLPLQSLSDDIKEKISESFDLFLNDQIYARENPTKDISYIIDYDEKKIVHIIGEYQRFIEKKHSEKECREQFVQPDFPCMDGWKWDEKNESNLRKQYIINQAEDFKQQYKTPSYEINIKKCIAVKNENGIPKEVFFTYDPKGHKWKSSFYANCDLRNLKEIKIFERVLKSLNTGLKIKNSLPVENAQKLNLEESNPHKNIFTKNENLGVQR